jgi:DNA-binding CsgD family transcriptional regulator
MTATIDMIDRPRHGERDKRRHRVPRAMAISSPYRVFMDRPSESQRLDELLEAVRAGESRALVVRGEAGIGKTALVETVLERASGLGVARAAGVQSELELPFAGLHQLCAPMLDRLERLPGPQRDALSTAFGLSAGDAPDRFFVGVAVLSLLAEAAEERPLVCFVDDAQWLDQESAQALAFVARRLGAEAVGLVFAARDPGEVLARLPELVIEGLRTREAHQLLDSVILGPMDERVRDRIVAETRGNPLALLELPRGFTPAELAGGFGLPVALPLSGRIEESFRRRLEELPAETQRLLLVAAAEPVGEPVLVWRAAERMGIGPESAAPAVAAGLLELGARVRFRHSLVRSAVYLAAAPEARWAVHRALAEVTDPVVDPDRRAWHRRQATPGPDDEVAGELERSAGRAQARGGLAAAAAFLEQAAESTRDPALRAGRALAAAQAKQQAGDPEAALALLATAESGPLDELLRVRVDLLRAQTVCSTSPGSDAPALLLEAARRFEQLDVRRSRETYLDALSAAMFVGRLSGGISLIDVAKAAREAPPALQAARAPDLLLDGLALLITDGYAAGMPMLKRALSAFRGDEISGEEGLRWLFIACRVAHDLWDDESWYALSARQVELARDAGAFARLPLALSQRVGAHLHAGELAAAASLVEEMDAITAATGNLFPRYGAAALAGWQGRETGASQPIGLALGLLHYTSGALYNGLGRYQEALAAAELASGYSEKLGFANWALAEVIEAAARGGDAVRAADALERLSATTRPSGTEWALGVEARSRALVSDGEAAEDLYREAIDRLGRSRATAALARAHLVYGEWLRRENRRIDARTELRAAQEMFAATGIEAFADRAASELLATGETARRRAVDARDELTAQEAQIARLARDGLSNPEIGARLFISRRTVEYHLHKVFTKLGITSRNHLHRALAATS